MTKGYCLIFPKGQNSSTHLPHTTSDSQGIWDFGYCDIVLLFDVYHEKGSFYDVRFFEPSVKNVTKLF